MKAHSPSVFFTLLATGLLAVEGRAAPVDYLTEVKPLLSSKCGACHGPAEQKGGLRLDTAPAIMKGGDSGTSVLPGQPKESLLLQTVLGTAEDIKRMPLKKPALEATEIATLRRWIQEGAKAPADERHWAFIAPKHPAEPAVKLEQWPRNAIDRFILARLEQDRLTPAPEADRATLIRRVKLDLIGLPPSIEETDAFLADNRPDAYERLIDAFLASPQYGERWGRLWLDGARYADSNGYSIDAPRSMWAYRDWVIDALNRDMPFDQFTIEQLAGDLLPNTTREQKIATGFHRNTQINQEGGIDKEQFRIESLFDRVATTGTVWLGLTIACAQCHDHKFDPLAQKEYYQFMAFFNDCDEPSLPMPDEKYEAAHTKWVEEQNALRQKKTAYVKAKEPQFQKWAASVSGDEPEKLVESAKSDLRVDLDAKSAKAVATGIREGKSWNDLADGILAKDAEYLRLKAAQTKLTKAEPKPDAALIMAKAKAARATHVFVKGDFTRPAELVQPGVPKAVAALEGPQPTRLDLAQWLVAPQNPLTARVTVNRLWQAHFGKGIVETDNDFGTQGIPPTHPQLLDWLATEFMARQWSQKAMHRLIVTSATYRQSSKVRPELAVIEPTNKLLARQNRFRLDAELVRDSGLAASGLLSLKMGGPSVFPPQPDGVTSLGQVKREWKAAEGEDRYRRGLYTFFYRATPHPALTVFDAADGVSTCTRRNRSNTPLQALTLLNDAAFYEMAQALADRALREAPADDNARLTLAFRLCMARPPEAYELKRLSELLKAERGAGGEDEQSAWEAWVAMARVLLNLDETITRE